MTRTPPNAHSTPKRSLVALALATAMLFAFALPASAQPQQDGLVNVNLSDVAVQLPIAVAANVCDVGVNVLAQQLHDGGAECDAVAEPDATIEWPGNGNGNGNQEGLVNVNVSDIVVQAPIGIAANICDINANVLAEQIRDGGAECTAETTPIADAG
jgi:hypothetical protein